MQNYIRKSGIFFVVALFALVLFSGIRGLSGNPTPQDLNTPEWRDGGPLELSPERGRFALTYSVVEDKSLQFSIPLARFITPDLAINPKGEYVSLFAPGVSFLAIPGYVIGRYFEASQVGAFATSAFFALLNLFLIAAIVKRLGGNTATGLLGGMIFVFATPAFSYAVTLYQHHISTFMLLLSIYILIRFNTVWSLTLIWFLCALSVVVDNPNLFFMFPVGVAALGRIVRIEKRVKDSIVRVSFWKAFTLVVMIFPIVFFLWFNQASHGDPLKLSGTLPGVGSIGEDGRPVKSVVETKAAIDTDKDANHEKTAVNFFRTRNLLSGFYIHSISPDRGVLYYTPIMFLGVIGLVLIYRRHAKQGTLLIAIVLTNVLLYSMWGDPWGGWAFGSRYLIPSYALLSVGIGVLLHQWQKSILVFLAFLILFTGSVAINTLGALTTNTNPPQVEVLAMEKLSGHEEKYTVMRNWQYLQTHGSKSFVYNTWAHTQVTPTQYYGIVTAVIVIIGEVLLLMASSEDASRVSRRVHNTKI